MNGRKLSPGMARPRRRNGVRNTERNDHYSRERNDKRSSERRIFFEGGQRTSPSVLLEHFDVRGSKAVVKPQNCLRIAVPFGRTNCVDWPNRKQGGVGKTDLDSRYTKVELHLDPR